MKRREVLQNISLVAGGLLFKPLTGATRIFDNKKSGGPGYIVGISIDNKISSLHYGYKTAAIGAVHKATELLEKSIEFMAATGDPTAKIYKGTLDNVVKYIKDTPTLTGWSVDGNHHYDIPNMQNIKASTGVHTNLLKGIIPHLPLDWGKYCDPHIKQVVDGEDIVLVKPMINNPGNNWYRVPQQLDYILYNPTYWCKGLPIENPVWHDVDKEGLRAKVGKPISVSGFYTQTYVYSKQECYQSNEPSRTVIYWGHDEVLADYFQLKTILPCGDPTLSGCAQDGKPGSTIRPEVRE